MKPNKLSPKDFKLLYDNVLIECNIDTSIVDEVGLYNPQGYEDKPEIGTVVTVGVGRILENGDVKPLQIRVGDIVYFNKYSTTKVRLDTSDFYLIREEDIQGYYREGQKTS